MGEPEEEIVEQEVENEVEGEEVSEDISNLLERLAEAESRANRLEARFDKSRDDDFYKKLESMPEEERPKAELEYERSKRHDAEMRLVRNEMRSDYPLFSGLLEIFSSKFSIEVDAADELREFAEDLEPQLKELFSDRISAEKKKVTKEVSKKWKVPGVSGESGGAPESKTQAQIRYETVMEKWKKEPTNAALLEQVIKARQAAGINT